MDRLILVDSIEPVPKDHSPELVRFGEVLIEKEAAEQLGKMFLSADSDGIRLKVFSGYRTSEYQQRLFMQSVYDYMSEGLCETEARSLTSRYIARPGHSEHQTGLACDICAACDDDADESFGSSLEGRWLYDNASRFGFILRYPRMKEHITGIAYEPWHYRYVGAAHSVPIMARGLTLEEYLYYYWFERQMRS